jgi:hypothetical protein
LRIKKRGVRYSPLELSKSMCLNSLQRAAQDYAWTMEVSKRLNLLASMGPKEVLIKDNRVYNTCGSLLGIRCDCTFGPAYHPDGIVVWSDVMIRLPMKKWYGKTEWEYVWTLDIVCGSIARMGNNDDRWRDFFVVTSKAGVLTKEVVEMETYKWLKRISGSFFGSAVRMID